MLTVEEGSDWGAQCKIPMQGSLIIGRSATCDLVLDDERASRQHFRLEVINGRFFATDLGSCNGTFVNETKVEGTVPVTPDDRIRVGGSIMKVADAAVGTLIGKVVGGYRLEERLGSGGMGEVYKAIQISLGRTVAVKILASDLANDEDFIEQFLAEARAAGLFNHPNVVQVYDVGSEGGLYYYSMEYQSGGSVQQHVQGGKCLAPTRALEIIRQAASALEFAETMGIVHCDIKPENLMLSGDGDVRLSDLGIARRHGETAASKDSKHVAGSPHYMSPEQAKGDKLDNRSDLYSIGATLYRLLAGRPPFNGNSAREVMEKQVYEQPVPLRKIRPQIPQGLSRIVDKLLQKKPDKRYQSARVLLADLDDAASATAKVTMTADTSDVSRITSFRLRVPNTGSTAMSKALGWLLVLGVLGGVAYGVVRHIYRGDRLYARAVGLERAGQLEEAEKVYEEALSIAGSGSDLGLRANKRLKQVRNATERQRQQRAARKAVVDAERLAAAGGKSLAEAFERVEAVALSGAVGREVAGTALTRLRGRLEDQAQGEYDSRKKKAEMLASEFRYGEAMDLFRKFPEYYVRTNAAKLADEFVTEVRLRADKDFKAAAEKAKEVVESAGTRSTAVDDAIQYLLPFVHRSGIPEISGNARQLRMAIETRAATLRKEQQRQAEEERLAKLERQLAESVLLAHTYRFAESRVIVRRVQNLVRDLGLAAKVAELDARVSTIARSEILFSTLEVALEEGRLNGKFVAIPGRPAGQISGFDKASRNLTIKCTPGETYAVPLSTAQPRQIAELFRSLTIPAYDHLVLAEFCLEHGLVDEAKREMPHADRVRPNHRAFATMIKALVNSGTTGGSPDEADANVLVELAIAEAHAGDVDAAQARLDLLNTRYARTSAAAEAARIEQALANPAAPIEE
jgi:serine/threonine protein kinase